MTTKNMNDIYNQMTKGQLSSSIKRTERQIESEIEQCDKNSEIAEIWMDSLENRVGIFVQRFGELPA